MSSVIKKILSVRISRRQKEIVEHLTDLCLILGSMFYLFVGDLIGWRIGEDTGAEIAILGASARMGFRSFLNKIVDDRLDSGVRPRPVIRRRSVVVADRPRSGPTTSPADSDPESNRSTVVDGITPDERPKP